MAGSPRKLLATGRRSIDAPRSAALFLKIRPMPRWGVDFIGKVLSHLRHGGAPEEKSAIAKAAETFNIPPARRNQIVVTKLDGGGSFENRRTAT